MALNASFIRHFLLWIDEFRAARPLQGHGSRAGARRNHEVSKRWGRSWLRSFKGTADAISAFSPKGFMSFWMRTAFAAWTVRWAACRCSTPPGSCAGAPGRSGRRPDGRYRRSDTAPFFRDHPSHRTAAKPVRDPLCRSVGRMLQVFGIHDHGPYQGLRVPIQDASPKPSTLRFVMTRAIAGPGTLRHHGRAGMVV